MNLLFYLNFLMLVKSLCKESSFTHEQTRAKNKIKQCAFRAYLCTASIRTAYAAVGSKKYHTLPISKSFKYCDEVLYSTDIQPHSAFCVPSNFVALL